jgi:protein-S-isoprenylcysteine O-methyltransferase Ste14
MLKLPPPFWALFYLIVAAAISYVAGWPRVPGLPLAGLGIVLIVLGGALAVTAARLFRREGTEINPTSPANRKLVTSGPYSFTRNPMYLGLTIISLGVAFGSVGGRCSSPRS